MTKASVHELLPKTRAEAAALGAVRYFTGRPCSKGHVSDRYLKGHCCECARAAMRHKYSADPAAGIARSKAYFKKNPDSNHKAHLKRAYGLPYGTYQKMLAAQAYRCGICGGEAGSARLHVDHCHDGGDVRGILCRPCNHMLGHAKDDPARLMAAIDYLSGRRVPVYSMAAAMLSFGA